MNSFTCRRSFDYRSAAAAWALLLAVASPLAALQVPGGAEAPGAADRVAVERTETLAALKQILGPLPQSADRSALDVQVEEQSVADELRRRTLSFQAAPEVRLQADLLIPEDADRTALPGVVFVLEDPDDRVTRQFAAHLARRGYACLIPRWQPQSLLAGNSVTSTDAVAQVMRAVDLLQSLPEVDDEKIGLIGNGAGGRLAPLIAALDPRINATIARVTPSDEDGRFAVVHTGGRGEDARPEEVAAVEVNAEQLIAAIAPRALMLRCSFTAGDPAPLQAAVRDAGAAFDAAAVPANLTLVDIDLHKGNQSDIVGELFAWLDLHLPTAER